MPVDLAGAAKVDVAHVVLNILVALEVTDDDPGSNAEGEVALFEDEAGEESVPAPRNGVISSVGLVVVTE